MRRSVKDCSVYVCASLHLPFRSQEGDQCQIDEAQHTQATAAILEISDFCSVMLSKTEEHHFTWPFSLLESILSAFCNYDLTFFGSDLFDLIFLNLLVNMWKPFQLSWCNKHADFVSRSESYSAITMKFCRSKSSEISFIIV